MTLMTARLGSWDGFIRLWKLDAKLKSFEPLGNPIAIEGIVNSLQLMQLPSKTLANAPWTRQPVEPMSNGTPSVANGTHAASKAEADSKMVILVAAIGQEPRFGRWITVREGAKNCGLVVPLRLG
jgi:ribosomal RNA-processing protein 9